MIVRGQNLFMTRGDSESISVSCKNYSFENGDVIDFTVKVDEYATKALIHKRITEFQDGVAYIYIDPVDTSSLKFGEYLYDIQLTNKNGGVSTIIRPHTFEIGSEVTY